MTPSEARELAAAALDRLTPQLPEVATASGGRELDTPIHRLYVLVAERLRTLGEQEALAELIRYPRNNSLVRRLLADSATDDPGYAEQLAAAVDATPPPAEVTPSPAARSSAVDGEASPRATAVPVETRRPRRYGPWVGVGAVVVLILVGVLVARAVDSVLTDAGGLTADSNCAEYRQAPPEERVAAIRQIGLAKGIPGVDSPLVMSAVDQLCETQPSARLGDLIARFDG